MERDQFLARVRQAVMATPVLDPPQVSPTLPDLDTVDLVALFRERAVSVNAVVHGPVSRHGVSTVVEGIVAGHDSKTFLAWDDLPVPGVISGLAATGMDRVDHDVPTGVERSQHLTSYQQVDLGITGADAGLAESGSVVLRHGPGRPRLASLVVDVHVALLDVELIDRSLAYWTATNPEIDSTNLVVVTGPSRTADIELQLNVGVHGPRHLHVVLIS